MIVGRMDMNILCHWELWRDMNALGSQVCAKLTGHRGLLRTQHAGCRLWDKADCLKLSPIRCMLKVIIVWSDCPWKPNLHIPNFCMQFLVPSSGCHQLPLQSWTFPATVWKINQHLQHLKSVSSHLGEVAHVEDEQSSLVQSCFWISAVNS